MNADRAIAESWLAAAVDPRVVPRLEAVYAMVREQIEARGPACWASGRCCNFAKAGHRLYVTGLEAAYAVARLSGSAAAGGLGDLRSAVREAVARGDCPFLSANLCGIHEIKPLGCRVYFCDRSAEGWQQDLTERGLAMIRAIHDEHGLEYRYGEWRSMLALLAEAAPDGPRRGG